MTGSYPGLHYFCLGLPNSNSRHSGRHLLAGPKWSVFHYSLASFLPLFSLFHYHSIDCHRDQSTKLVHAFSQAPKKDEDRLSGKIISGLKTI